ncbi:MAG: helix-turn-helix domain-containing protein, partial [Proteobacteria bacterium]|nr:helix-turn-helix domain-containing protein [Pseudomonadota bacterium]
MNQEHRVGQGYKADGEIAAENSPYPISLVSAVFGTNRTTLWRWIKRFASKGLPGLID